jgi:hypothetical protein
MCRCHACIAELAAAARATAERLPPGEERDATEVNEPTLSDIQEKGTAPNSPRTLAISLPYSSLERGFRCRRLARQKGPEDDVSAQRLEIGDHHTREMAAKTAFLLASYQLRVSQDCVVADAVERNWSPTSPEQVSRL